MPGYVSHTIMARDVYNKINNKNIDLDYMLTFSLGGDLCKYSKCRKDSHHIKQDEFIYNMADYLKENNLENDSECLGFLYGHICHLAMDEEVHPLVRKVDKECIKSKNNHTMIELYYDNYLTNLKYDVKLNKYNNKDLFKGKINKKISKLIDYVYKKTYNCDNVSKYYKLNLSLYKKIKYIYKLSTFNFLKSISGMNKFLKNNDKIDLINDNRKICYNDIKKNNSNYSLIELYDLSVNRALNDIKHYNDYLYGRSKNGKE